jgi:hypothetical protein
VLGGSACARRRKPFQAFGVHSSSSKVNIESL